MQSHSKRLDNVRIVVATQWDKRMSVRVGRYFKRAWTRTYVIVMLFIIHVMRCHIRSSTSTSSIIEDLLRVECPT